MDPRILYAVCVLGAVVLYVLIRPGPRTIKVAAALVGLGALSWLLVQTAMFLGVRAAGDQSGGRPDVFFVMFSLIAIACAVRMITHSRPVYSALYFIMVVLSSAALFLMLQAEFLAFALVIVYAGAILITYLFVLMLAQQAPNPDHPDAQPDYDVLPREPAAGAVVGFIMLALFTNMVLTSAGSLPKPPTPAEANSRNWDKLNQMPGDVERIVQQLAPGSRLASRAAVHVRDGVAYVDVLRPGETHRTPLVLPSQAMPSNVQLVGVDLVAKFPVSLELAGVILLLAMFGAVVLARKQIELGEDEVREAAGMRKLAFHADETHELSPVGGGER